MPSHYGPKTTTDSLVVRLDPAIKIVILVVVQQLQI